MSNKIHYAIGDIHGCDDQLEQMHERIIATHQAKHPDKQATIIHLGDYVDRGPDSKAVIDRLMRGVPGFNTICLKGNHEALLLKCAHDDDYYNWEIWLRNGGDITLESFQLSPSLGSYRAQDLNQALGKQRLAWLAARPLSYEIPGYFFVHAGVRPGKPLSEQVEKDLLWIRSDFLDSTDDHGAIIIHGHTPCKEPEIKPNRINVDTGACYGGKLTAVMIEEGRDPHILQVP